MRSVRAQFDARLRQSRPHKVGRVRPEVDDRQRLVLVPRFGRRASRRDGSDQRLDRLALDTSDGRLDPFARAGFVRSAPADRDRDDALEPLERDAVEFVTAEKVEEDRLELGESRVRVPQGGVRFDGRKVEQRDGAGGRFDALQVDETVSVSLC